MAVLGVCGDSFMAATINGNSADIENSEGKHFTEILAKKLGYDYFTLARGAASNTAIRLQIGEMVKQKVDLCIVGFTGDTRLEIPHLDKTFDLNSGVYNLDYRLEYYPDRSCLNKNFHHNMISDTITNIFSDFSRFYKKILNTRQQPFCPKLTKEQLTALEHYLNYLYEPNYKKLLDSWAAHSGITLLKENNINYIVLKNDLFISTDLENLDGINFIPQTSNLSPYNYYSGKAIRRWHTDDESQEVLADLWFNYLTEHNLIRN